MKLQLAIFLIVLGSCTDQKVTPMELSDFHTSFKLHAEKHRVTLPNIRVTLSFDTVPYFTFGDKNYTFKGDGFVRRAYAVKNKPMWLFTSEIHVNKQIFDNLSYYEKEALIFHELAHIYLDRHHNNRHLYKDRTLIPLSIMNRTKGSIYYTQNRNYYLKELFK